MQGSNFDLTVHGDNHMRLRWAWVCQSNVTAFLSDDNITKILKDSHEPITADVSRQFHAALTASSSSLT